MKVRLSRSDTHENWYHYLRDEEFEVENEITVDGWFTVKGEKRWIRINDCVVLGTADDPPISPKNLAEQISTLSKQINELSQQLKQALQS